MALLMGLAACGSPAPGQSEPALVQDQAAPEGAGGAPRTTIAVLGDSITAGLGLTTAEAYPARLEELFRAEGYDQVDVLNAGVSGDTTAGGRRRVESLIVPGVKIVVVALGGNDALRGVPVSQTRADLTAIIESLVNADIRVLLVGMEGPTNLGEDYRARFRAIFSELSNTFGRQINFIPFLLEGVGGNPSLNQPDGIHPTADGMRIIAEHLYPTLRDMVDQLPPMPEGR